MRKFHAHVAQSAKTHHANFLAFGDAPVAHGRVGGDAGAEQRRGSGKIEIRGNMQHKALIDHDAVGIAAIGDAAEVLIGEVVGEGQVGAELFKAGLALGAGAIGIDHAADRGKVARLEFGDGGADVGDAADNLMAGNARVDGGHDVAPLIADLVEIGVADAAEQDLDLTSCSVGSRRANRGGGKRRCRAVAE